MNQNATLILARNRCLAIAWCVFATIVQGDERAGKSRSDVANLSALQLADLAVDDREFAALTRDRQAALSAFADALAKAPDKADLESTMMRYARWLDTLTPAQKQRLDSAESTPDRLAVVRKLIDEQKKQLDKDLKRLREHEWSNVDPGMARINPGLPQANIAESQKRAKLLIEKVTPSEKRNLGMLKIVSPRDANAYSLVLGIKYGVMGFPANVGDWFSRVLPREFRETDFYRRSFSGVPFAQLDTADRARLRELIELSFTLTEVTTAMALKAYPINDSKRQLYELFSKNVPSTRPFALVYYFDHPDELNGDKKLRFEKLQKPGSATPLAIDEKPLPRTIANGIQEKINKRAAKKAGKEPKDG